MVLYNTAMGFCAGLIILIVVGMVRRIDEDRTTAVAGKRDAVRLLILGVPLTVLAGAMALTWPLKVNPPINIAFSEPALMLGLLAIAGGVVVWQQGSVSRFCGWTFSPIVGALGLMMTALSVAILRFDLVGDAPAIEPITGQVTGWENTTFAVVYALVALGCFASFAVHRRVGRLVTIWSWGVAGVFFLLFSVLNYYTHVGLLTCSGGGPCHSF